MNVAFILLTCVPTQSGLMPERSTNTTTAFRINVGPTVQNRDFRVKRLLDKLKIKGNNNSVYISYSPVDMSYSYYNSQRYRTRRPLFRRFRRSYP